MAVAGRDGKPQWLDAIHDVTATFRPGYTEYDLKETTAGWTAKILVAPAMDFHGLVCRVQFDRPMPLYWQYGGVWWQESEPNANRVALSDPCARITEPKLPGGLAVVGCDGPGELRIVPAALRPASGIRRQIAANVLSRLRHVGRDELRQRLCPQGHGPARYAGRRPGRKKRDGLKRLWFDCYIKPALEPESHFAIARRAGRRGTKANAIVVGPAAATNSRSAPRTSASMP